MALILLIVVVWPGILGLTGSLTGLMQKPGFHGVYLFLALTGVTWGVGIWGLGLVLKVLFFRKSWFVLNSEGILDQRPVGGEGFIPWHRVLEIRDRLSTGEGRVMVLVLRDSGLQGMAPRVRNPLAGKEVHIPLRPLTGRPEILLSQFRTFWKAYGPWTGTQPGPGGASQSQSWPPTEPSRR